MANPESLLNGQAETLDPIYGPDGTVYLKAAGDSQGIPTGASDPTAPQLVQLAGADYLSGPPTGLALAEGTGTLGATTYYYRVSAITTAGETTACAEVGLAITATHGVDLTWNAVRGATGYRVYGRSTGAELFIAEVSGTTLAYTDSGSITPAGALPTANTARIVTATDPVKPATATRSNVNDAASDTLLLAANAARKGATVWNDSAEILYLGLGTVAASATSCTVKMPADAYYELPAGFTGQVRGIWANNGSGAARITELV